MSLISANSSVRSELSPELRDKVQAVVEKFHTAFPQVEINRMAFVRSTSRGKKPIKIMPVRSPYEAILSQKFIIVSYGKAFDELDPARQNLHIFRELLRIEDFEGGKLEDYQVKDFQAILEKYGSDWEENDELTDILTEEEE